MTFTENLKLFRRAKELSQNKLADILNISAKTVSHWETGYTEPSIAQLILLADLFDTSIDELVGRIN